MNNYHEVYYRLMRLINNLIDVTRIDAGFMTFNDGNWDILELLKVSHCL